MALGLLDPIEPVLDHVARILFPGGAFGAIVRGPLGSGALMDTFQVLLSQEQLQLPTLLVLTARAQQEHFVHCTRTFTWGRSS